MIRPEVQHGNIVLKKDDYDLLDTTIISLTQNFRTSESDIIRLLGTIFMPLVTKDERERTLQEEFGIPMTEEMKEDLENMCNLSDGIFEMGEAKGISIGEKRGEIIGAVKTYQEVGIMPTEIIKKIMGRFGLKEAEAEKYVEETLGLQLV